MPSSQSWLWRFAKQLNLCFFSWGEMAKQPIIGCGDIAKQLLYPKLRLRRCYHAAIPFKDRLWRKLFAKQPVLYRNGCGDIAKQPNINNWLWWFCQAAIHWLWHNYQAANKSKWLWRGIYNLPSSPTFNAPAAKKENWWIGWGFFAKQPVFIGCGTQAKQPVHSPGKPL